MYEIHIGLAFEFLVKFFFRIIFGPIKNIHESVALYIYHAARQSSD